MCRVLTANWTENDTLPFWLILQLKYIVVVTKQLNQLLNMGSRIDFIEA